jgi:hypothetical protein
LSKMPLTKTLAKLILRMCGLGPCWSLSFARI